MIDRKTLLKAILILSLLTVLLSTPGCEVGQLVAPTATPTATSTSTPKPTNTPKPTFTSSPVPTATPVPEIGKPVASENWEITVIGIIFRDRIYPGGGWYYTLNPDYMFIDVTLKAKALGSDTSVFSSDILIVDENGEEWSALWSGEKDASKEIDPFTIGINQILDEDIDISTEKYLRLMFILKATNLGKEVYFQFEDVPAVPVVLEK